MGVVLIRGAISMAALVGISGCAFRPEVSHMAVEYNEFAAQATNRQTVINILRARDREPLHFTSFSGVHGSATIEGNASIQAGIVGTAVERVPDATSAATPKPFMTDKRTFGPTTWTPNFNVKVDTGTSFDIAINSTDDFWKGIMKPLDADTVAYYLQQGWSPELLSYLFMEKIDYIAVVTKIDPRTNVKTKIDFALAPISNDLADAQKSSDLKAAVQCRPLAIHDKTEDAQYIEVDDISQLRGVSKDTLAALKPKKPVALDDTPDPAQKAKYRDGAVEKPEKELPQRAEVAASTDGSKLALSNGLLPSACLSHKLYFLAELRKHMPAGFLKSDPLLFLKDVSVGVAQGLTVSSTQGANTTSTLGAGTFNVGFTSKDFCTALMTEGHCDLQATITLRSTEGVIYYLGEYVRHSNGANAPTLISIEPTSTDPKPVPVPIIRVGTPDEYRSTLAKLDVGKDGASARDVAGPPFVQVEFKGVPYLVFSSGETLGPVAGRSSEVITLVQQLLNLYRTAKDLPTTQNVRVIN